MDTGVTDVATLFPSFLDEWDYSKNFSLDPHKLFPNADVQVGWVCNSGHKWATSLASRVRKDTGCPFCAGRQASPGINDVFSSDFGASWDFEANGEIDPSWIHRGSRMSYFWVCEEGHKWKSKCTTRNEGKGCPTCSPTAYSPTKPGILYFIKNDSYGAMKVGITNGVESSKRLAGFTKAEWTVVATWRSSDGWRIAELESRVLFWIRQELGLPPHLGQSEMRNLGGWTETFSGDGVSQLQVITKINEEAELLLKPGVDN